MVDRAWTGIQPGDIGFDRGGGVIGFLIRHFSHSPYAHCWVYHSRSEPVGDDPIWVTAEAYPGGLKYREREQARVHRVVRVWRDEDERQELLSKSDELVGSGYNYRELFRIIHYRIRKMFAYLLAVYLLLLAGYLLGSRAALVVSFVLLAALLYGLLPLKTKLNEGRVICSNHVAQSTLAARPEASLSFAPQSIWPGRLEQDLNIITWHDWMEERG